MGGYNQNGFGKMPEATSVQQELKRSKAAGWRDVVICVIIILGFLLYKEVRGEETTAVTPRLGETEFTLIALDGTEHRFVYDELDSIELHDDLQSFDRGTLVRGNEAKRCVSGRYTNDAFGEYELHIMTKLNEYLIVKNADGVMVFNIESDETTQALYDYICGQIQN